MVEAKKYGLLLVMMEPPEEMEEEFNEWYDTEHIPEREAVPVYCQHRGLSSMKAFHGILLFTILKA